MKIKIHALVLGLLLCAAPVFPAEPAGASKPKGMQKIKKPIEKIQKNIKKVAEPVQKTAEVAVEEVTQVAKEAHTLGGKFLQGIINVMIAASPGKTRVYLPAPSADPNSGVTVGLLPVFLFVDKQEVVKHIFAPSITYNHIYKMTTTLRYYWYPRKGAQFFTLGSYALETNRRLTVRYEDPTFFDDRFYFKFDFTTLKDGSYRFFGIGPNSDGDKQFNYTYKDNHLQLYTGINLIHNYRFTVLHRFHFADAVDGPIDSMAQISQFNPRPEGAYDSRTTMAQRMIISYDSRDLAVAPVSGHNFAFFGETAGLIGGNVNFERIGTDLRGFYPLRGARFVTGWRLMGEILRGDEDVPFYERSLLGGKDSLRGFGDFRFVDQHKVSFTLEERVRFYTLKAFNVNVDFEVTPFYETGTVFPKVSTFQLNPLKHVFGVGFRAIVRPNVVGVVDLGFGSEGSAVYVGIDYPF